MSRLPGKRARPVLRGLRRGDAPEQPDWRIWYYLLDDALDMMLVNASRVRNVPGRKTDVADAAWLADLGAHGLVTASLVPPAISTLPLGSSVAVWKERLAFISGVDPVNVLLTGSYNSVLARDPEGPLPPANSTLPLGNRVVVA